MGSLEQLLLLQQAEIAPDCGGGHTQLRGELADAYASGARKPLEHGGKAFGLAHLRKSTRSIVHNRVVF